MLKKIIFLVVVVVLAVIGYRYFTKQKPEIVVTNFEECVAAGYPVMESYPRRCQTFVEDIGNELEKRDLIMVSNPRPNQLVASPLIIFGEARGTWFFEGSFPIRIYDENGEELGLAIAQTSSEWMTTDFVPFTATIEFETPVTKKGNLIFEKDNPSDFREYDDELIMPVWFK